MASLIKDRTVAADPWLRLELTGDGGFPGLPASGDVVVPLAAWREQRGKLLARPGRIGIWLDGHEDPAAVAEDLRLFGVVAVNFPKFTDGRGYSTGRLLRERYGYRGELRAIGDIFRDQILYLSRCGFNAFVLRPGEDLHAALAGFAGFSEAYQASVEQPLPLFRRRLLASHGAVEWSGEAMP
jgi:uncharacterized protein (DUF934 family)